MAEKLKHTIAPEMIEEGAHVDCQEQVYRADEPGFDLRKLVPAPTNTPEDAGPYITMGLAMGTDPENGTSDVTIHRFCIEGKDTLAMFITPGSRHLADIDLNRPRPCSLYVRRLRGADNAARL